VTLSQRVAIVTGGGTGIGLAIAQAFLYEGAQVIIASRNKAHLDAGAKAIEITGHKVATQQLDVTDQAAVRVAMESIAREYGRIDILVNNAGLSGRTPMNDANAARWQAILATNLNGSYFCSQEALRFMPDGQQGRIINMSSVLGRFGVAGYAAYCTAKHGILGFTKALALEVAPRGITVNAICPTWVDTPMARQGIDETAAIIGITPEEFRKQAVRAIPIGRMVEPSEVAALAVFLASPAAAGITGEAINISGGATASSGSS
jgi:3-hydroxybutyrate dehydrogenase